MTQRERRSSIGRRQSLKRHIITGLVVIVNL